MTPNWKSLVRRMINIGTFTASNPVAGFLAECRCFDLSGVKDLIEAAADEIPGAVSRAGHKHSVDLGPRTVVPADKALLDWHDEFAMIERIDRSEVIYPVYRVTPVRRLGNNITGPEALVELIQCSDGYLFGCVGADNDYVALDALDTSMRSVLMKTLAALAVISSPATRSEPTESHRGLARKVRKIRPNPREIVHTRIILEDRAAPKAGARRGTGDPKAYHFCRSHRRQISSARFVTVRAHWRGDPAFGIRLPTYEVPHRRMDAQP